MSKHMVEHFSAAGNPSSASNPGSPPRPVLISAFGPPALAAIRSWGSRGFPVGLICIQPEKQPLPRSRYLTAVTPLNPDTLYTDQGFARIDAFLNEYGATGIMPINEKISCWLNHNRGRMKSSAVIWAPETPVIQKVLSKGEQLRVAREVGFELLPTYLIEYDNYQEVAPEHFPLCLRPDAPGTVTPAFKVHIVQDRQDLTRMLHTITRMDRPLLAQPFVNLPNLVVHGSRTVKGTVIGMQSFLVERKFQGVTLTIRPTSMERSLATLCSDFVERFALVGCFHFEFLFDPGSGKAFFLEINGRLGGTTAKVYACGYDEPLLALEAYGVCESGKQLIRNCVVSGKHALIKYLIYTITNKVTHLDYPMEHPVPRLLKTLWAAVRCKDEILSRADPQGSFSFYRSLLRDQMN